MFYSVSWQEFLTAALVLLTGYYLCTTLLLYRREIMASLKRKRPVVVGPEGEEEEAPVNHPEPENLMGESRDDEGAGSEHVTYVSPEQLELFSSGQQEEEAISTSVDGSAEVSLLTSLADLLDEVKTLVQMVAEYSGGKEDAAAMFQSLLDRYPHLADSRYREALTLHIYSTCRESCDFSLQLDEVSAWWTIDAEPQKTHV